MRIYLFAILVFVSGCFSTKEQPTPQAPTEIFAQKVSKPKWVLLDHKYFKVFYDPQIRLARYVVYTFDAEKFKSKKVARKNSFRTDPMLVEKNIPYAKPSEYKNSGFDQGHMAPFNDFSYSDEAGRETFVMSNMEPQTGTLNRNSWKQIEAQVHKWGCGEKRIIVITGPIITDKMQALKSGLGIPNDFFKIVIDDTPPRKAIGFVYHQSDDSKVKYKSRITKVTEIEKVTGEKFEDQVVDDVKEVLKRDSKPEEWVEGKCG